MNLLTSFRSEEELQILNEPRQRKNKEEEVKKDAKGKPQPAKAKPPAGKAGGKKEEAPVEEKKEERVLPRSENHVMDEICKFLTHMEQPRLLEDGDVDDEEGVVRTEEEKNELREKILLGVLNSLEILILIIFQKERRSLWNV